MEPILSYEMENGKTTINEGCYRGKSEKELEQLRQNARSAAKQIFLKKAEMQREK